MPTVRDLSGNNSFGIQVGGGDFSGSITTGGTAQQLAPAMATRKSVSGQNISTGDLWIREGGTAAVDGIGSYKVPAGESFYSTSNGSISIIGATTGQKFSAKED